MRKDALQKLIDEYEKICIMRDGSEDIRIRNLKKFLEQDAIKLLSPSDDISFQKFNEYLLLKYPTEGLSGLFDETFLMNSQFDLKVSTITPSKQDIAIFKKSTYVLIKNFFFWKCIYYEKGVELREIPLKEIGNLQKAIKAIPDTTLDGCISSSELCFKEIQQYHFQCSKINASVLFKKFINAEKLKFIGNEELPRYPTVDDSQSTLSKIPRDVRKIILAGYLDNKSTAALAATS